MVKEILNTPDFQSEVAALGDYDISLMGQVMYETL